VPQNDVSQNELEIWYDGGTELAVEVIGPTGRSLGRVALGASARVQDRLGRTTVFVAHRRQDPNNGDNVIGVFLSAAAPAGVWKLRLHGVAVTEGTFHAWIERDDTRPSHFLPPHDNRYTLGSLSTGHKSIVVGAYNAHAAGAAIAPFSGAGPTRDGRQKPELSAPGQSVWAARSLATQGLVAMSGTSMAAPAVTGVIALLLAEARTRGQLPDVDEIRRRLQETALHDPPPLPWDARYGAGRVWAPGVLG
jgi:subtilisin family serine protease